MFEQKINLKEVRISNFLSLRKIVLPLKQLTVLVGPNASGKSNVLNALSLVQRMMVAEDLPPAELIQDSIWAGEADSISFELNVDVDETPVTYKLELKARPDNPVALEELIVNDTKVILVEDGQGEVRDEDGENLTKYRSVKLALKSAGDYGNKPITNSLSNFVGSWEFYDFQPSKMRGSGVILRILENVRDMHVDLAALRLDDDGSTLAAILSLWYQNDKERFEAVNAALESCTNLKIDQPSQGEKDELCLLEGYETPIPLKRASDGTLRLIAYYILLNQKEIPPLIAIEEPERNLHPAALTDIATALEQLSRRTQVIITTHSSQLLDAFSSRNLSDNLGVLLLRNILGKGTEVVNLEEARRNRASLDGWIEDFGIGSAIFDSELLQDLMGD